MQLPAPRELLDAAQARLSQVFDPEIPVLTIAELGILRDVRLDGRSLTVQITPTYCGCPAVDTIADDIERALADLPVQVCVERVLSPPWTTDWMSEAGKRKLREYGIAPPVGSAAQAVTLYASDEAVPCPKCSSARTRLVAQYGSTACKALYRCMACAEPFDYFKPH